MKPSEADSVLVHALREYERRYGSHPKRLTVGPALWAALCEMPPGIDPENIREMTYLGYELVRDPDLEAQAVVLIAPPLFFSAYNMECAARLERMRRKMREAFTRESPVWYVLRKHHEQQSDSSAAGAERELESENRRDANGCSAENDQG